ncbi:MAG TPA: indole-3-glycerol phosphate synthase TrpC [Candidatus Nanopelagicaceae bacterium]|nr:indole-3-glycerol phosphate synthase TrpC [Candidatus Nanopelagicaceae bacterium]
MNDGALAPILAAARTRAIQLRAGGVDELTSAARLAPPPRPFEAALRGAGFAVIAEMKRRSPSAGPLRMDLDPAAMAADFQNGGAAAISVLTEPEFFSGAIADLEAVRGAVPLPVLRKDFVVDPLQVFEARAGGADAVLLIVRAMDRDRLADCLGICRELGMAALVEVHDEPDMEVAAGLGASLIGINNRDLDRLTTDLQTTQKLAMIAPPKALLISESGIKGPADVELVASWGVAGVLIGERLMRAVGPASTLAALVPERVRRLR